MTGENRNPRLDHRAPQLCKAIVLLAAALLAGGQAALAQAPGFAGDEVRVNAIRRAVSSDPRVAVLPDGGFAVVWRSTKRVRAPSVLHARFFGVDDAPLSGEFLLLPPAPGTNGYQSPDALLADGAGNLLLVWTEGSSANPNAIFAQRLSGTGAPRGPRIPVSEPSRQYNSGAVAALTPDGGFAVAWTVNIAGAGGFLTHDVDMRRFAANGRPLGPQVRVFAGSADVEAFAAGVGVEPDGSVVLAYLYGESFPIAATQRFAPDGTPGELRNVLFDHRNDDDQINPLLLMQADGSHVVVWNKYGLRPQPPSPGITGVGARFFTPDGTPNGDPFQVNRYPPGDQILSGLAALPAGGFIALWTDTSGRDGDGLGVYARAFAAAGKPLTRDIRINQTTAGNQYAPVAAANAAGDIVAVWIQERDFRTPPRYLIARRLKAAPPAASP